MKRIGFIGAQSMHTVYFGEALAAGVPGLDSTSGRLWAPDIPGMLGMRLAQAEFSGSFDSLEELLDYSDAVMILTRDGNSHKELAEACLARRRPVFVSKPFACTPSDAVTMKACSERYRTPLMGGSTLCFLPEVAAVAQAARQAEDITISFAANWDSPYGGWYHEGSHLTDLCAAIAGCSARNVSAALYGKAVAAKVEYPKLKVRLLSFPDQTDLRFSVNLKNGETKNWIIPDYERCYRLGMERFSDMLRSGKSVSPERLVFSTQLTEEIVKSLPDVSAYPTGTV